MAVMKSIHNLDLQDASREIKAHADQINANTTAIAAAVTAAPVAGVAAGYKEARGETALDGTNPTPITTGLATVTGFSATLKGSVAPGLGTTTLTYTASAGTVSVYAWKPTSISDPTLIASTGTETFGWVAVGT